MNEKDLAKKVDTLLQRHSDNFLWNRSDELKFEKELIELFMQYGKQVKEADMTQPIEPKGYNVESMIHFETGAKRSSKMPRYDLIPKVALDRLAQRFTGKLDENNKPDGGALKYGEGNWEKGLPTSDVINHTMNHLTNYMNKFRVALSDPNTNMEYVRSRMVTESIIDDDLAAAMWGLAVLIYQEGTAFFHDDSFPIAK